MATRISTEMRDAACNAIVDLLDAGATPTLKVYTGSQPASAEDAATGTLLATFSLDGTAAFGAAATGVATLDVTPAISTTGAAAGTAGWFRAADSTDTNRIDGSVGQGSGDLSLDNTVIAVGQTVNLVSWTVTMPAG